MPTGQGQRSFCLAGRPAARARRWAHSTNRSKQPLGSGELVSIADSFHATRPNFERGACRTEPKKSMFQRGGRTNPPTRLWGHSSNGGAKKLTAVAKSRPNRGCSFALPRPVRRVRSRCSYDHFQKRSAAVDLAPAWVRPTRVCSRLAMASAKFVLPGGQRLKRSVGHLRCSKSALNIAVLKRGGNV